MLQARNLSSICLVADELRYLTHKIAGLDDRVVSRQFSGLRFLEAGIRMAVYLVENRIPSSVVLLRAHP